MWAAYLPTVGALLLLYLLILRPLWLLGWRLPPPAKHLDLPGNAIDPAPLSHRVEHVRAEMNQWKAPTEAFAFKKELLVSDARLRVAKLAFLQTPSSSGAIVAEPEHPLDLVLF